MQTNSEAFTAWRARAYLPQKKISLINNANVLAMGARVVSFDMGCEMAERFLAGQWCEGFAEQRRKNNERGFEVLKQIEEEQRYD